MSDNNDSSSSNTKNSSARAAPTQPPPESELTSPRIENGIEVDSGKAWVIVFASFVIQFIDDGVFFCFGIFFVQISKEFSSVGKEGAAWIASIMIACTHAIGPLGSILVNKWGCRVVTVLGAVIVAAGYVLSYFATQASHLYLTIGVVCGLGFGFIYLPSTIIVPQYFEKRRSLAVGVSVCGAGLGVLAFERIFELMLNRFEWRQCFLITAGIILSTALFSIFYGPHKRVEKSTEIEAAAAPDAPNQRTQAKDVGVTAKKVSNIKGGLCQRIRSSIDWSLLRDPYFLLFAVCDMLSSIGFNVPYIYLPEIEKTTVGRNDEDNESEAASTLLGIMGVANVLSRIFFGYLSDKPFVNRLYLYNTILIIAGLGTIASPHLTTIWWLRAYAAFYGSCIGTYTSLKTVILVDLIGLERLTDAFGLFLLVQAAGFIIGPPIVGELYDTYGSYREGFYFAGATFVVSGALLFSIPIMQAYRKRHLRRQDVTSSTAL